MNLLDEIFEMTGGYVLNFTNRTFSEFFREEFSIDIYNSDYETDGDGKAKRLRCYLRKENSKNVIKVLLALWEYREITRNRAGEKEIRAGVKAEFSLLIGRLGGTVPGESKHQVGQPIHSNLSEEVGKELLEKLTSMSKLEPHQRGFAFEKFLKKLFDENGMHGRGSFRIVGEQIDGSFEMYGETYLLEAKWTSEPVSVSDLYIFNAKVEGKASWSRGLFVSYSGFTESGLSAFGKGKRLVCMDGLDISDMLQKNLSLQEVLSKKVRRAAETGNPFVRLRDLI